KMYDAMSEVRAAEEPAVAGPTTPEAAASLAVETTPPTAVAEASLEVVATPPAVASEMPMAEVETAPESGMPLSEMADFAPVQAEDARLVKVVFFYSDGHFEEYARR
ncbi:MAG: hypothetical protein K2L79_02810, partial [Bacteroidales bacterium]|nr:hypothetical protein [Bacteroidales bacterium]